MDFKEKLKENTKKMMEIYPIESIREILGNIKAFGLVRITEEDQILNKFMGRKRSPLFIGDIDKAMNEVYQVIETGEFPENFSDDFHGCSTYIRDYLIPCWSYALLSNSFIKSLSEFIGDKRCLEVMAGRGLLSALLKDNNVNIITTDNNLWEGCTEEWCYTDIEIIEAEEAVRKYGKDIDYIVMSWPPMGEDGAYRVLKAMREVNSNARMIYIGEINGGTADTDFFDIAEGEDDERFYKVYDSYEPFGFVKDKPYLIK